MVSHRPISSRHGNDAWKMIIIVSAGIRTHDVDFRNRWKSGLVRWPCVVQAVYEFLHSIDDDTDV